MGWLWKKKKPDFSFLPEKYIVFDFETTGLDSQKHEIIEVAAICANRDSDKHTFFQSLVIPQKKISQKITQITNITNEMVEKEGEPLEKVIPEFIDFIGTYPLVAYNAKFDILFLSAAVEKIKMNMPNNQVNCALDLARRAWPGLKSYKLENISRSIGSTLTSHRALDDCQRALIVYCAAAMELRK